MPADKAAEHIFGYMVTVDVSDRGGRPPDSRPGSDWFVGKGHDTFAPMGPWIVPKEFYGDPMKRLRQTLTIDGKVMQEAGASDMIHSIYELIEYGSSIITLYPGDVVNNGTSGGTGMGQAYRARAVPQAGREVHGGHRRHWVDHDERRGRAGAAAWHRVAPAGRQLVPQAVTLTEARRLIRPPCLRSSPPNPCRSNESPATSV